METHLISSFPTFFIQKNPDSGHVRTVQTAILLSRTSSDQWMISTSPTTGFTASIVAGHVAAMLGVVPHFGIANRWLTSIIYIYRDYVWLWIDVYGDFKYCIVTIVYMGL